jgi:phage regulator Rha-like protein
MSERTRHQTDLFPETLLVEIRNGVLVTSSLTVAKYFGKQHKHVLRDISIVLADDDDLNFGPANFELSSYLRNDGRPSKLSPKLGPDIDVTRGNQSAKLRSVSGQQSPMYYLTEEGFAFLAMGFTGRPARALKKRFLRAFVDMRRQLAWHTERFARALDELHPSLRPVVEGTEQGHSRADIAAPLGKSPASVTYHRRTARRLGLLRGARA